MCNQSEFKDKFLFFSYLHSYRKVLFFLKAPLIDKPIYYYDIKPLKVGTDP